MKKILLALAFVFVSTTGLLAATTTHTVDAVLTPLSGDRVHVTANLETLKHEGDNQAHNDAVRAYLTPSEKILNDAAHQAELKAAKAKAQEVTLKVTATDKDGKIAFEMDQLKGKTATMFLEPLIGAALSPALLMVN